MSDTTACQAAALLARIGTALYGELWQSRMARDLGIADRTVRRYAAGEALPPAGVWADLRRLVDEGGSNLAEIGTVLADERTMAGLANRRAERRSRPTVERVAWDLAVGKYLSENGRHNPHETLTRVINGQRLSAGAQRELDEAQAFADGLFANVDGATERRETFRIVAVNNALGVSEGQTALDLKRQAKLYDLVRNTAGVDPEPFLAAARTLVGEYSDD